jgi:hypothetical protein
VVSPLHQWITVQLLGKGPSFYLLEKKYEHDVGSTEVNVIFPVLLQLPGKVM